mgnify:CR=1 FL=1
MISLQDITFKHFSESDASAGTKEIDTLNADYLVIQFFTSGGSNGAMAALKLQESDASGSGQADISGTDLSSTVTSPAAVAADEGCALYLTCVVVSGTSPSRLTGLPRLATMLQRLLSTISDQSPLLLPTGKAA